MTKPLVLIDPDPRSRAMILSDDAWAELNGLARVVAWFDGGRMPREMVEQHLPEASIIIGQTSLNAADIARASKLRAVINVKGNWEPTLDYAACQANGIHVLSIAPAMAQAVAEWCLGAAIDLGRGLTQANTDFRAGTERYGIRGNENAVTLYGATVALIGYGNLGRALRPLLAPFGCEILVHDPWLPAGWLAEQGSRAVPLDEALSAPNFLFLLAGVTTENAGFLGATNLAKIRPDACVILASRAEIVDLAALTELAEAGKFRAAVDVFPEEPVPPDHPIRRTQKLLLSSHRAGGTWHSYGRISAMMMDDVRLVLQGLPPMRLQRAEPRLAAMMRSR